MIKWFDCEIGKRDEKALLILDSASCHKIKFEKFKNLTVEFLAPTMTGYSQPLDMGYFATVKKRFCSFRRNYMVDYK